MAPHSSTLAWKIPWTEEPGRMQSVGSLRVGHDWATLLSLFTFMHWRRKGNPLQCSCLENPRDGSAWWAAIYGVTQSRTRLKWCSSSSSSVCVYVHVYMSIPTSQFSPSPPYPLITIDLFSTLWLYFCFVNKFICSLFFLIKKCCCCWCCTMGHTGN